MFGCGRVFSCCAGLMRTRIYVHKYIVVAPNDRMAMGPAEDVALMAKLPTAVSCTTIFLLVRQTLLRNRCTPGSVVHKSVQDTSEFLTEPAVCVPRPEQQRCEAGFYFAHPVVQEVVYISYVEKPVRFVGRFSRDNQLL